MPPDGSYKVDDYFTLDFFPPSSSPILNSRSLKRCTPRDALSPARVSVVKDRWCSRGHVVHGFISGCGGTRHIRSVTPVRIIILKHWGVDKLVEQMRPSNLLRCHRLVGFTRFPTVFHLLGEAQLPISTLHPPELTTKGTKSKSIDKAPATNLAVIGDSFSGPRLRTFVQEHYLGTINNVRLNTRNVQISLNLIHPNHVMVRGSPNLNNTMVFVMGQTVRTEGITTTIQTIHIAFTFIGISMETTSNKVISS